MGPPSLGQQSKILEVWWKAIVHEFVVEQKRIARFEEEEAKQGETRILDERLVLEVPLAAAIDLLTSKNIVVDYQNGMKFIFNQLGSDQLQKPNMICQEEWNKVFCKGMFKQALKNTIDKL